MRAVQVSAPGCVEVTVLKDSEPSDGEVIVDVRSVGVCGTDRRLTARGADPPRVPGHEVAGRLDDGTPVAIHPDIGCGECEHCRESYENRCRHRVSIGIDRDGGMAEQVAVPEHHVVPLDGVDLDVAPLLEPLACCLHAASMLGPLEETPAMVVGAGPMGILATWALQARGARVLVVQRSAERRELAAALGADSVAAPDQNPAEILGAVPEVALVTAPSAAALTAALENVAVGGTVHAFAGLPGGGLFDANLVHYRHLALVGSTGSRIIDFRDARSLVADGRVLLDKLPVTRRTLSEADAVLQGNTGDFKTIIDLEE